MRVVGLIKQWVVKITSTCYCTFEFVQLIDFRLTFNYYDAIANVSVNYNILPVAVHFAEKDK